MCGHGRAGSAAGQDGGVRPVDCGLFSAANPINSRIEKTDQIGAV